MVIRRVSRAELEAALAVVNEVYAGNIRWNREPERRGSGYRFTLRVVSSRGPGARVTYEGRRIASACWHVHGRFFDALPAGLSVWTRGRYYWTGTRWMDFQAGRLIRPAYLSELCVCPESQAACESRRRVVQRARERADRRIQEIRREAGP